MPVSIEFREAPDTSAPTEPMPPDTPEMKLPEEPQPPPAGESLPEPDEEAFEPPLSQLDMKLPGEQIPAPEVAVSTEPAGDIDPVNPVAHRTIDGTIPAVGESTGAEEEAEAAVEKPAAPKVKAP